MAGGQGGGGVARLLPWRRGDDKPDQGAVLCSVSEVTAQDGQRHVVEFHALVEQPALQGWYWLVRSSFTSDGAPSGYNCRRYVADGGRTVKGVLALQAARSELARHGSVIHREPCPHCHLGIWRQEPAERFVHAATDQPQCPDGQGTDCNEWTPTGFGDLPPWPPTGSCW
ncbi:hypothetical protein [Streptacidiphilus jiangxiensis]|uniref:Uncharacterized protein n=1 Tax=Streptacidiphilus jiangxiensis TaxID=235985 RepID=A0A1H8BV14_STRJI|nr:hypothetical protein [Streptacidiphilus jiangxiensis]SEM86612.1 hypothetical protein SAMN05414137_1823 [Streptacidiphilus jiangxiensis]